MRRKYYRLAISILILLLSCNYSFADVSVSQNEATKMVQSQYEKYWFDWINNYSAFGNVGNSLGFRNAGSTGEKEIAISLAADMKRIGLKNVTMDKFDVDAWEFTSATLKLSSPNSKSFTLSAYAGSVGTPSKGINTEIVDVGAGTAADYEGKDVKGKIVFAQFVPVYDYWMNLPAHQAELEGAKAIIIGYTGSYYGNTQDCLNSFDGNLRPTIPVLNISRKDAASLKELLSKQKVTGTLNANIKLDTKNGKSSNIVGMIPGKNPDQYIIMGSHYDGYFHSFQDDLFGCGVIMSVAKSMIDSGYQPEHTIVFIMHGAEEYGISDNFFDYSTGAWNAINKIHPEWAGKTMAYMEVDGVRPDGIIYQMSSTPELHTFLNEYKKGMELPKQYVSGSAIAWNGASTQDIAYAVQGVPTYQVGRDTHSAWQPVSYHTTNDNASAWNPAVFSFIVTDYIRMAMNLDRMAITPLNFSTVMDQLKNTLDVSTANTAGLSTTDLLAKSDKFKNNSNKYYNLIVEANNLYNKLEDAQKLGKKVDQSKIKEFRNLLFAQNRKVLSINKLMEKDLLKFDVWESIRYEHEVMQSNYKYLRASIDALNKKNGADALTNLMSVDSTYNAALFDKDVYEYAVERMNPARNDLYFGNGKTLKQVDTYDVYHSIENKIKSGNNDFSAEIVQLNKMLVFEKEMLNKSLKNEALKISEANSALDIVGMEKAVKLGNELVNKMNQTNGQ